MRPLISLILTASALLLAACGDSDESDDAFGDTSAGASEAAENEPADESADDAGSSSGADDAGGAVHTDPFPAVSATANLPHGVGPVGVIGECSSVAGSYRFSSSGDDRFDIVILDGSPPTAEAAQAILGSSVYTFVSIDTVEADASRYFISGTGAEQGREDDAGPMSFTILCRA